MCLFATAHQSPLHLPYAQTHFYRNTLCQAPHRNWQSPDCCNCIILGTYQHFKKCNIDFLHYFYYSDHQNSTEHQWNQANCNLLRKSFGRFCWCGYNWCVGSYLHRHTEVCGLLSLPSSREKKRKVMCNLENCYDKNIFEQIYIHGHALCLPFLTKDLTYVCKDNSKHSYSSKKYNMPWHAMVEKKVSLITFHLLARINNSNNYIYDSFTEDIRT